MNAPANVNGEIAQRARFLYRDIGGLGGQLQRWRPYVCPFGPIIDAVSPGSRVLDIGCGGGLYLGLLADAQKLDYGVGVDVSETGIRMARHMSAENGFMDNLEFHCLRTGDPLPAGPFDVVTLIDVLHHVPAADQRAFLIEASRRVRTGGRLVVKEISTRPRWRAIANKIHDLLLARQWVHHITGKEIMDVVDGTTNSGVWTSPVQINMLWYGHTLMVFEKNS